MRPSSTRFRAPCAPPLVFSLALVALAAGCRFSPAGLPIQRDGGPGPDGQVSPDGQALPDGQVSPDGQVAPDGQVTPDGQVLPDAQVVPDARVEPDAAVTTCVEASCPLGCNLALDRCNRLDPRNFDVQGFHGQISAGIAAPGGEDITVDTGSGEIRSPSTTYRPAGSPGQALNGIYFAVVTQAGGGPLAVFGLAHLDVPDGVRLSVEGPNPAAFYITGDVTFAGELDAWGVYEVPGPGGGGGGLADGADGLGCHGGAFGRGGGQAGSGSSQLEAGGGGGGFGGSGGTGGNGDYSGTTCAGGAGGVPVAMSLSLTPLSGGCGGGAGGGPDTAGASPNNGGAGGGGGGGIQLSVAGELLVTGTGVLDVGGGQGQGGQHGAGGGGGGSGGGLLLEAANLVVDGVLVANGGGAGAGAPNLSGNGEDGEWAHQSSNPALGGTGTSYGGNGGNGGAGGTYNGGNGQTDANGGGGGGATGIVGLYSLGGLALGGALISPDNYLTGSGVSTW